tara:strand:+ start:708 stop:911 length:204 start_codon:yes stop_codon:yes gene_type:complete
MIPVEGYKNLYRDENSGAIISTDTVGYSQYIQTKSKKRIEKEELDRMKSDIDEIKSLLKEIVNRTVL